MRRRSWASTTKTYSTSNPIVGTVKKSTDTMDFTWFSRKSEIFLTCDAFGVLPPVTLPTFRCTKQIASLYIAGLREN
jgi:ATP-dependent phosphoenolpyruvate carboxykinase